MAYTPGLAYNKGLGDQLFILYAIYKGNLAKSNEGVKHSAEGK